MKKSTFLGNQGLSQSEANHTANIAKEIADTISVEISGMSLYKETLHDKHGQVPYNFVKKVDKLEEKCLFEGKIYALSAWLREGIKAKQALINEIQLAKEVYFGLKMPVEVDIPKLTDLPIEAGMVEELGIAERAEFLAMEAKAAHIGKKVHPGGLIPQWRKSLANAAPVKFIQSEKDYLRITVEQLIQPTEVEDLFYTLQKEHREAESRVNYYKAKMHNLFNQKTAEINAENALILDEYRGKVNNYHLEREVVIRKMNSKRAEMLKEASDLKIVVPNELQDTMDYIQTYSRKK